MFGDILELTTSLINPEHEPDFSQGTTSKPSISKPGNMPPRSRHAKSASVSSNIDVNGMPPPSTPVAKASTPARKPRRRSAASPPTSPITPKAPSQLTATSASSYTPALKFVLVVVLSTVVEASLQSTASRFGTGELASISKHSENWAEVTGLLVWKVLQLALYWFGNFDAYDVASLTLLISTPSTILLALFYQIRPVTLAITTAISIFSTTLPWLLLRPLSHSHKPSSAPKYSIRNRTILTDPYTTIATSLLATAIFAVLLEASFATFLPEWLAVNFRGLRTLEAAHLGASGLPALLLALLPAGVACMAFLFAPSTAAQDPALSALAPKPVDFDPVTASFFAHVYHNAWGWYSTRQKSLIARSTILAYLMVTECVIQIYGTIEGTELGGSLAYAGIWAVGVAVVGAVLDWVGGPSD